MTLLATQYPTTSRPAIGGRHVTVLSGFPLHPAASRGPGFRPTLEATICLTEGHNTPVVLRHARFPHQFQQVTLLPVRRHHPPNRPVDILGQIVQACHKSLSHKVSDAPHPIFWPIRLPKPVTCSHPGSCKTRCSCKDTGYLRV